MNNFKTIRYARLIPSYVLLSNVQSHGTRLYPLQEIIARWINEKFDGKSSELLEMQTLFQGNQLQKALWHMHNIYPYPWRSLSSFNESFFLH